MIENCLYIVKFKQIFEDYLICVDYHKKYNNFGSFDNFNKSLGKSILFCAVKHREGSDIPNVDGCIFMDGVNIRSEKLFVQCIGRVLRRDKLNKKKYGLVIDLKAQDVIEVCNRIQFFLKLKNAFPFNYSMLKKSNYYINILDMIDINTIPKHENILIKKYSETEIKSLFVRKVQKNYLNRINFELSLIIEKCVSKYIYCITSFRPNKNILPI